MNRPVLLMVVVLVVVSTAGGWWYVQSGGLHSHEATRAIAANGQIYYTCPMHPQVRQPEPGACPVCGMTLLKKHDGGEYVVAAAGERKVLYWYDPMQPAQHFDRPGRSPFMDMDLVPKYSDQAGGDVVYVDPRMVQNLGVRIARVERGALLRRVDAAGAVELDERSFVVVESRAAGWVEELHVRAVDEPVRRGQPVAGVYSPDILAAQEEFLLAANAGDTALEAAARRRLELLGLPGEQISSVLETRQAQRRGLVLAPTDGVVTEINVREGGQITPGTALMRIANLARVWVGVDIPEAQGAWIVAGDGAEVRFATFPGRVFAGRVEYVHPRLDVGTRTVRARLVLDNPGMSLKPGMFADVTLQGGSRGETLLVPTEAVIRTGERSVVILAEGGGRFRPAAVTVGDDRAGRSEILSGLMEGESIVISGQFLIDSEANLRGALTRMDGDPPAGRMRQLGGEGAPAVYGAQPDNRETGDAK